MASGAVTPDFQASIQIFDTQGGFRTLTLSLLKSATPNEWHAELHIVPSSDVTTGAGLIDGQVATGTIAFTPNGLLDTGATSPSLLNVDFLASGAAPGAGEVAWASSLGIGAQSVAISLGSTGSFTQFDSPSNLISYQVDGAVFGGLAGVRVNEEGFVTALFDNGVQRRIYQIPVATFINPSGLQAANGNAYTVTNESGPFNLKVPGTAGAGKISASSLESSTVDIAQEFTNLITTQRAYSAATRIITTADEMLNELIQTRR
jgi:flagellar hook protein FlgE